MGCRHALPIVSPSAQESPPCSPPGQPLASVEIPSAARRTQAISVTSLQHSGLTESGLRSAPDSPRAAASYSETTQSLANAVFPLDPESISTSMSRVPSVGLAAEISLPPFCSRTLPVGSALSRRQQTTKMLPPITCVEQTALTDGADDISLHLGGHNLEGPHEWRDRPRGSAFTPRGPQTPLSGDEHASPLADAARSARKRPHHRRKEAASGAAVEIRSAAESLSVAANHRG